MIYMRMYCIHVLYVQVELSSNLFHTFAILFLLLVFFLLHSNEVTTKVGLPFNDNLTFKMQTFIMHHISTQRVLTISRSMTNTLKPGANNIRIETYSGETLVGMVSAFS